MKIGVQTLPLHINYGGILQAYALQTALQRMGHEVYIIDKSAYTTLNPVELLCSFALRWVKRYILQDKRIFLSRRAQWQHEYPIISQYTQSFIDRYINCFPCKEYSVLPKNCFDAIVVGSDQVWRPKYFGKSIIADAYLEFARDWDIKRIAYAASFGTDKWEYSRVQTAKCRALIAMFDAVSVREDSAVRLCKKHFDVDAKHVVDPTMLLHKEDYIELVNMAGTPQSPGDLLVYILDQTPDKQVVVDRVATTKGLTPFDTKAKGGASPEGRVQPPVEQWIRGFMDAEFVVTDSFHACVFAIIFNKPFIAYGNVSRGSSRFVSMLSKFGLQQQFISKSQMLNIDSLERKIDWVEVNRELKSLQQEAYNYLREGIELPLSKL